MVELFLFFTSRTILFVTICFSIIFLLSFICPLFFKHLINTVPNCQDNVFLPSFFSLDLPKNMIISVCYMQHDISSFSSKLIIFWSYFFDSTAVTELLPFEPDYFLLFFFYKYLNHSSKQFFQLIHQHSGAHIPCLSYFFSLKVFQLSTNFTLFFQNSSFKMFFYSIYIFLYSSSVMTVSNVWKCNQKK